MENKQRWRFAVDRSLLSVACCNVCSIDLSWAACLILPVHVQVNASVDVYAFGVMMWELFVGQRPYGNMSQQKVVEEVVLRGLRPCFPVGTPPGYAQLAASCWHAIAGARPNFGEVISRLQVGARDSHRQAVRL
jgi:hypothetical protein